MTHFGSEPHLSSGDRQQYLGDRACGQALRSQHSRPVIGNIV